MSKRKIEAMYAEFGKAEGHTCKKCSNLICGSYHDKHYSKCLLYGLSRSAATDWAKRHPACGAFNKDMPNGFVPLIRRLPTEHKETLQVDGQQTFMQEVIGHEGN